MFKRSVAIVLGSSLLAACGGGGATPIGDNWFMGITVGIIAVAAGVCWLIYRDLAHERRQARRDERTIERPKPHA